jgi:hypothetical protein
MHSVVLLKPGVTVALEQELASGSTATVARGGAAAAAGKTEEEERGGGP